MKQMIARMARTLQNSNYTVNGERSQVNISIDTGHDEKTVTARSFFSKENQKHPAVKENMKLKSRLKIVQ